MEEEIKDIDIDETLGALEEEANETPEEEDDGKINFVARYVDPHKKISREVTDKDMARVLEEAHVLYNLCFTQLGVHSGAVALAHPQIDDEDPLRFFVTYEKEIVINPRIIRHTGTTVDSLEGCLSFPGLYPIKVQRWNKCVVKYRTVNKDGTMGDEVEEALSGKRAKVFEHEQDHFDGIYIYDI